MTILEHEIMMTEQLRRVPADELQARLNKFRAVMDREFPGWEIAIVNHKVNMLSLIHISEPTRLGMISYAVFCLKKKKQKQKQKQKKMSHVYRRDK